MEKNRIKKEGFIYITDSGMVTMKKIERIGYGIQFISRLPATYNECSRLIKDVINIDDWVEFGNCLVQQKPKKDMLLFMGGKQSNQFFSPNLKSVFFLLFQ